MKKSIELWNAHDPRRMHHALAVWVLDPAGPLRHDVDLFVAGTSRDDLPGLHSLAGGLGLIRTTERSIEGRMSQLGRVFKHGSASGPATVNHCLRFPNLEKVLLTTPEVDRYSTPACILTLMVVLGCVGGRPRQRLWWVGLVRGCRVFVFHIY